MQSKKEPVILLTAIQNTPRDFHASFLHTSMKNYNGHNSFKDVVCIFFLKRELTHKKSDKLQTFKNEIRNVFFVLFSRKKTFL